ncbi:unnamed protein product [Prunus armeniaca]
MLATSNLEAGKVASSIVANEEREREGVKRLRKLVRRIKSISTTMEGWGTQRIEDSDVDVDVEL